jgi:hypothetical protein
MTLRSTLSNLSAHFKYYAAIALAEDGPQHKVRAELMKEGWSFKNSMSDEEMKNIIIATGGAGPAGCLNFGKIKIFSPEGEEVFTAKRNKDLEDRYKQAVRQAAAHTYGLKP